MSRVAEIIGRWQSALRNKASLFEHEARRNGEAVLYPSLDDIANEMEAFLAGADPK